VESSPVGGVESGWRRTARERSPASGRRSPARWVESRQVGGVQPGRGVQPAGGGVQPGGWSRVRVEAYSKGEESCQREEEFSQVGGGRVRVGAYSKGEDSCQREEEFSQVGGVESGWRRTARERSPAR
jgi:hypothetical protein